MKKYLNVAVNVFIYAIVFNLMVYAFAYLWFGVVGKGLGDWTYENQNFGFAICELAQLPILYFYLRLRKQNLFQICNFSRIGSNAIITITLIGIASGLFTMSFFEIPYIFKNVPDFDFSLSVLFDHGTVLTFIVFLLVNSFFKEILFRGLIFNELKKAVPVAAAIIIQGFLYGVLILNFNPVLTLYGFLGATIFVLLYILYKSLWASIYAQIITTATMYVVRKTGDLIVSGSNSWIVFAVSMAAVLIILGYVIKTTRKVDANAAVEAA